MELQQMAQKWYKVTAATPFSQEKVNIYQNFFFSNSHSVRIYETKERKLLRSIKIKYQTYLPGPIHQCS